MNIRQKQKKCKGNYKLRVTNGRGRQLIAKTWLIHRTGLREQTLKEYPYTQAMYQAKFIAIVSAVSVIVAATIGSITTYILSR
jgi:hypothetical protein